MHSSILIGLVVLIAVVAADEQTILEKFTEIRKTCSAEHNLSDESLNKLKAKDFSEDTENVHCYIKCTFEKAGFLNGNVPNDEQILKVDAALNKVDHHLSADRLTKCKTTYPTVDDCKAAHNIIKCFRNAE